MKAETAELFEIAPEVTGAQELSAQRNRQSEVRPAEKKRPSRQSEDKRFKIFSGLG